jgi:hypothetical protein
MQFNLESLDKPIETDNGSFWPVVASCYNLEDDGSRIGNLQEIFDDCLYLLVCSETCALHAF